MWVRQTYFYFCPEICCVILVAGIWGQGMVDVFPWGSGNWELKYRNTDGDQTLGLGRTGVKVISLKAQGAGEFFTASQTPVRPCA